MILDPYTWRRAMVIVALGSLLAASAWAGPGDENVGADTENGLAPIEVAVLPFAAVERRMSMYGKPVADVVARSLTEHLDSTLQIRVQAISLTGAVPRQVDFVIDGRIVSTSLRVLSLEVQLRDPEHGRRLAVLTGESGKLTDIDRLARSLGQALASSIANAARTRRNDEKNMATSKVAKPVRTGAVPATRAGTKPAKTNSSAIEATASDTALSAAVKQPDRTTAPDKRPAMVVFAVSNKTAGGRVEIQDLVLDGMQRVVSTLGYRVIQSSLPGPVSPAQAATEARALGADKALLFQMQDISFARLGVLSARGRFRAFVIDIHGRQLYNRTQRTDTLVGARGDRHRAVVRFVVAQAATMLRADLVRWKLQARGGSK